MIKTTFHKETGSEFMTFSIKIPLIGIHKHKDLYQFILDPSTDSYNCLVQLADLVKAIELDSKMED